MKINTTTKTVKETTLNLSGEDILKALGVSKNVNARITFEIPGGGDYSNFSYNFLDEALVKVTYTEIEESVNNQPRDINNGI